MTTKRPKRAADARAAHGNARASADAGAPPRVPRKQRADAAAAAAALPTRIASVDASVLAAAGSSAALATAVDALGFDGVLFRGTPAASAPGGLRVLAEVRLDLFAGNDPLVLARPDCFRALRDRVDRLPDPRWPETPPEHARARFDDPSCAQALLEWWAEQLAGWFAGGLAGVVCTAPQALSARHWRSLIDACRAAHPQACFTAWTPGLAAEHAAALAGSGFDAVFSSLPWWDFQSGWLFEEHERLRRIGAVLAPVADPASPAAALAADGALDAGLARRLGFAAATADGVLVPLQAADVAAADGALPDTPRTRAQRRANALLSRRAPGRSRMRPLWQGAGPGRALLVEDAGAEAKASAARLVLVNADDQHVAVLGSTELLGAAACASAFEPLAPAEGEAIEPGGCVALEPGEVRQYRARAPEPVRAVPPGDAIERALQAPRVAIEHLQPAVDGGRYPAKRVLGDVVEVEADVFSDGHEHLDAVVRFRAVDEKTWREAPMRHCGNDRWRGEFLLTRVGRHEFQVEAWRDRFGSLHAEVELKRAAGNLSPLDVGEAVDLVAQAARRSKGPLGTRLKQLARRLASIADLEGRASLLLEPETSLLMAEADDRPFRSRSAVLSIDSERRAARFSSWYELFPRSMAGDPARHGRFDDVIAQLPRIRDMGFDVLYMPPIHPIGLSHRKGRNNSLRASPGEPGSPYAIGSDDGGHDAIHPELGTLEDFRRLREAAAAHGLELALDFAIQCSPDHPWLKQHPEWFAWRADGSVRYAENPPKKYQDIVNVDFHAEGARPSLWLALRDVVQFWVDQGVKLFRVDNPHTKPYAFWEWMIADIRARDPDVLFLSEAFTRPNPMYHLAKIGFSQSYTYFTWRHGKQEFMDFMRELADGEPREFYRPHFFVNTPDINPVFLQRSGRPGHLIRAALATTLSGLWGMYSGFELCEATPVPGKEEYLDSEKYQLRAWDWDRPGNIVAEITRLNLLRRLHPALQSHLNLRFYNAFNDQVLYFGKRAPGEHAMLLVAICLDPQHAQECGFEVPLWEWGLPDHAAVDVEDLWHGRRFRWHGKLQQLRLDPQVLPFAIWRIQPPQEDA